MYPLDTPCAHDSHPCFLSRNSETYMGTYGIWARISEMILRDSAGKKVNGNKSVETQSNTAEVEPKLEELIAVKSERPGNLHPKFLNELVHESKGLEL